MNFAKATGLLFGLSLPSLYRGFIGFELRHAESTGSPFGVLRGWRHAISEIRWAWKRVFQLRATLLTALKIPFSIAGSNGVKSPSWLSFYWWVESKGNASIFGPASDFSDGSLVRFFDTLGGLSSLTEEGVASTMMGFQGCFALPVYLQSRLTTPGVAEAMPCPIICLRLQICSYPGCRLPWSTPLIYRRNTRDRLLHPTIAVNSIWRTCCCDERKTAFASGVAVGVRA